MQIGAHVSIAGGLYKSIDNGMKLGVDMVQSFASSPRSIKYKEHTKEDIQKYLKKKSESQIKSHVFHGVYLINLAHENREYVDVCVDSLIYYQNLADKIAAMGTVFHIGSHKGAGFEAVLSKVAIAIAKVTNNTPDSVWLLLENTAGQSGVIGSSFEELMTVMEEVNKLGGDTNKIGVCVDTQHAFAGGYDLRSESGLEEMIREIDSSMGMDKLKMIHVNDSMVEKGSNRDRHANVGEGEIGSEGLKQVINHPKLKHLPFVLEVPGEKRSGPRRQDVDQLRNLI